MGSLFDSTQNNLKKRRQNLLDGHINSIPSPFKRFKEDFVGLEQAVYYCITSFTKGAKTQFVLYLLFEAICYHLAHPESFRLKILYFNLEETAEKILTRFESYLLFKLDRLRVSPKALRSSDNEHPIPEYILDLLESEKYQVYIKAFEECVEFCETRHPTGIEIKCKELVNTNGIIHRKKIKFVDNLGIPRESEEGFDYYEPYDPNLFTFVIVDHLSLINPERGKSLKESLDELSKTFTKYRNRYSLSFIAIQQQSTENESNDSIKLGNIRPSGRGLADSKYTQRDVNILLGLTNPFKFGINNYFGYDITKFRDNIRFLEVCANRDGELGSIIALYFDGATNTFMELPPSEDTVAMQKWYQYLEAMRSKQSQGIFYMQPIKQTIYGKCSNYLRSLWNREIHKHKDA